jgi:hypothetical protein
MSRTITQDGLGLERGSWIGAILGQKLYLDHGVKRTVFPLNESGLRAAQSDTWFQDQVYALSGDWSADISKVVVGDRCKTAKLNEKRLDHI